MSGDIEKRRILQSLISLHNIKIPVRCLVETTFNCTFIMQYVQTNEICSVPVPCICTDDTCSNFPLRELMNV